SGLSRPPPVDLARIYSDIGIDYTGLYLFDCAVRPGTRCRGDAFARRVSVIPSARLHRRFVIATTDRDASTDFFHRRPASRVLGLISRLCAIHPAPVTFVVEYYAHLLRATGLLLCRLLGPQHRRACA
ncbi:hypothetical protein P5E39_16360, partial [Clostridium perfringens]|nr:hypothetical protein [Clostridium perfringens]